MIRMKPQFLALVLIAALALAACGGESGAQPTEIATSVPDSTSGAGPASLDLDDPEAFQEIPGDYSLRMDFRFEGVEDDGSPISGQVLIEGLNQADPIATSMDITAIGDADLGGVDHLLFVESEGRLYFYNEATGCVSLPDDEEEGSLFNNLVDTGGLLGGVAQRAQPDEVINGVPSYHFALGPENLDPSDPTSMDVQELSSGSIYVAKEGGYVVRLVLEGVGVSELLTGNGGLQGEIYYQLDFEPEPDGVTITLPEGCEDSEVPESEFPVLDDASNVAAFGGFYSYRTTYDFETVVDFYKTELAAAGWTLEDEISAGTTAALNFSMGARNLSLAIVADPNAEGALNVVIAEEQ